jgi:hypothetical protein
MLQLSQFSWVVSSKQSGINFHQACSIWKCMIVSNVVTMDDVDKYYLLMYNRRLQIKEF